MLDPPPLKLQNCKSHQRFSVYQCDSHKNRPWKLQPAAFPIIANEWTNAWRRSFFRLNLVRQSKHSERALLDVRFDLQAVLVFFLPLFHSSAPNHSYHHSKSVYSAVLHWRFQPICPKPHIPEKPETASFGQ